jgi:hypothetical protein
VSVTSPIPILARVTAALRQRGSKPAVARLVLLALLGTVGCSSGAESDGETSPSTFVETDACRDMAQSAVESVEAVDEATGAIGGADIDSLTYVDYDSEDPASTDTDGPVHAFSSSRRDVALYCSSDVIEKYLAANAEFFEMELMWGNHCAPELLDAECDEGSMSASLLTGIEEGHAFIDAINRKAPPGSMETTAVTEPERINLIGSLRLVDHVKLAPDGEGGQYCYGDNTYPLGYGDQVVVADATGTTLALGEVDEGQVISSRGCEFNFVVEDVPNELGVLSMSIGEYDGGDFTIKQYLEQPRGFQLLLGN